MLGRIGVPYESLRPLVLELELEAAELSYTLNEVELASLTLS